MPQPHTTPEPQPVSPNYYELSGDGITITYGPNGPIYADKGRWALGYQHGSRDLDFYENDLRVVTLDDLGTCVSITLADSSNADWKTATLVLPKVVLRAGFGRSVQVETVLITTVHSRASGSAEGQVEKYTVTKLTGQATLRIGAR
jgi:hypothetical protein